MNILLLVPDGVGVRNFILGPFLSTATVDHKVDVLHNIPYEQVKKYERPELQDSVHFHQVGEVRDRPLAFTLRNSLSFSQTYWVNNFAMQLMRNRERPGSWRTQAAVWT